MLTYNGKICPQDNTILESTSSIGAIPHWRAYIAKKLILFQQDKNVTTYVRHM